MISMNKEDLHSQQGMERALREYLAQTKNDGDGSFNGMLAPSLVSCDYEKRQLVLQIETAGWMGNPNGVVHGGVSSAMLDMTMGLLARYFSGGGMTPTVHMDINYLRAIPMGQTVCIKAELPMRGFTLCHTTGALWVNDEPEQPSCTASGVYIASHKS